MFRVLLPVDGSKNCRFAVQHVIRQFMNNTDMEIHLLNVQPPFSRYVGRFIDRKTKREHQREKAEAALQPVRAMLDASSIPYSVHADVGDRAQLITSTAQRLRCNKIVMSTARKNSLTRLVESSVTNKVIQLTSVPVEVIAGEEVSNYERYGIPATIGAAVAILIAAAD